jgi:hypothetical protein
MPLHGRAGAPRRGKCLDEDGLAAALGLVDDGWYARSAAFAPCEAVDHDGVPT